MAREHTPPAALQYTSRHGVTWYLHEGVTKTGKPRFFVARAVGEGARPTMPAGMTFRESVNGVVSVARIDPKLPVIPPDDLAQLGAEMGRLPDLRRYVTDVVKGEIVVYEPIGVSSLEESWFVSMFGLNPAGLDRLPTRHARYSAVLKFKPEARPGIYSVSRWVSRGEGFWLWLDHGKISALAQKYLPFLGTDEFFELM